ncbi:MAG: hypothetical protein JWO35_621 [Candidatus Saccharibacteria bacterium]|nr:hypothetical protein [Candidatus Saccharibacteria bacterium]
MRQLMSPHEALSNIQQAQEDALAWENKKSRVAVQAATVLSRQGSFVFVSSESRMGKLLTRATPPLSMAGGFIALRDKPEYNSREIELWSLPEDNLKQLQHAGTDPSPDVKKLAVFHGEGHVTIPSVPNIEDEHLLSLGVLLEHIDSREPNFRTPPSMDLPHTANSTSMLRRLHRVSMVDLSSTDNTLGNQPHSFVLDA